MIPSVNAGRVAITGALSFTGRYLAAHLLERNLVSSIVNLSSRTTPISSHNISPEQVESSMHQAELSFHDPARLTSSLEGVDVLYCTYWIRFSRGDDNHFEAAKRCRTLFECAQQAGVQKVVFTAHTGMSLDSPYQYIAGKVNVVLLMLPLFINKCTI
jgi:nucleoside-diphosphate-sugar epimerase